MTDIAPLTRRLLVLDDNADVAETVCAMAGTMGFEARTAIDAQSFLAELDDWAPTHIALDLIMPDVDGIEVMLRLVERRCRAQIVILSGAGERVLAAAHRAASEHGLNVVGVLGKPLSLANLRRLLNAANAASASPVTRTRRAAWEPTAADLSAAIERRELVPWFQPKVRCNTRRLEGFEALVRWDHPKHGLLMPDRFIALAEETGLIDPLTDLVINSALTWLASATFESEPRMAINLSARSLVDLALADRLADVCGRAGISAQRVTLEVTETSAMSDPLVSLDVLTRLRIKGFELSIDDFGVGHSSLIQLARLPFSEMKIDLAFVREAAVSAEARKIIRAIVELGHSLGLRLTAEGVEDVVSLEYLHNVGCDYAQGYFIARPMPGEAVTDWLRTSVRCPQSFFNRQVVGEVRTFASPG